MNPVAILTAPGAVGLKTLVGLLLLTIPLIALLVYALV